MAKIIKKKASFKKPPRHKKPHFPAFALLCLAVCIGYCVYGVATKQPSFLGIAFAAGAVGLCALVVWLVKSIGSLSEYTEFNESADIRQAGKSGEKATGHFLSHLPDSYTVIMNAVITYDGKQSEIDNIVVGPTGVFIIESKNHNGTITADYGAHDWLQVKVGRGGTPYRKTFYSPVKQVGTHVYRLAHYLRENRINTRIEAAVFFSNPKAKLHIVGKPNHIPIFTTATAAQLLHYITDAPEKLSADMVKHIIKLLD